MPTYGQIRFDLAQLYPGAPLPLLDSLILESYQRILEALSWQRQTGRFSISVPPEYNTGTVAVTNGSPLVTFTGGTLLPEHRGRMFRVSGDSVYYQIEYVSATTGRLDRVYEGETNAASAYRINKVTFTLDASIRVLDSVEVNGCKLTQTTLVELPPSRLEYGQPTHYALYMDAGAAAPVPQIEIYPVPTDLWGLFYGGTVDAAPILETSSSFLPWVRPGAIKANVQKLLCLAPAFKDLAAAELHEKCYQTEVEEMKAVEAERLGTLQLRPDRQFTAHRTSRAYRRRISP